MYRRLYNKPKITTTGITRNMQITNIKINTMTTRNKGFWKTKGANLIAEIITYAKKRS
jgi:hypothetical protein